MKSRIDDYRIYRISIYRFKISKCPPLLFCYEEFNIYGEVKTTKDDRNTAFSLPLRGNPACNLTIKIISCVSIEWKSSGHRPTTGSFTAGCVSTICKAVDLFLCALLEKFPAWDLWEFVLLIINGAGARISWFLQELVLRFSLLVVKLITFTSLFNILYIYIKINFN